ncbi:MAG: 50S ribosomal protein L15e [Candidatus Lokiarchaeota archaeon]|nr:50S ribosomal protein L15e [Candidatus Lokiarchaeota archaeon]
MTKSAYRYISETFQNQEKKYPSPNWQLLIQLRNSPSVHRIAKPSNIARARSLGYKAKQGYVIVRSKIRKGSARKIRPKMGRKPGNLGVRKITTKKNLQRIAEERAAKRFPNLVTLNSYYLIEDGRHKWFEVILVDPNHPRIIEDPKINWITHSKNKRRAFRGLTSAGKRGRGLRKKGIGAEKIRPSLKANRNRGK